MGYLIRTKIPEDLMDYLTEKNMTYRQFSDLSGGNITEHLIASVIDCLKPGAKDIRLSPQTLVYFDDVMSSLDIPLEYCNPSSHWKDISGVPKDGTVVDLWHKEHGRVTNAEVRDDGKIIRCVALNWKIKDFTHYADIVQPDK